MSNEREMQIVGRVILGVAVVLLLVVPLAAASCAPRAVEALFGH